MHVYVKDVSVSQTPYADKIVEARIAFYLTASEMHDWRYIASADLLSRKIEETLNALLMPPPKLVRNKLGVARRSLIIERE